VKNPISPRSNALCSLFLPLTTLQSFTASLFFGGIVTWLLLAVSSILPAVKNRHRRKTAVAALLLLGASLIAVGSVQPWAKISGPHIGLSGGGKTGRLGFDSVPQLERSGDTNSISILLVVAAVIALCAIAFLVTRVRSRPSRAPR
jgi:hypothetical protein